MQKQSSHDHRFVGSRARTDVGKYSGPYITPRPLSSKISWEATKLLAHKDKAGSVEGKLGFMVACYFRVWEVFVQGLDVWR